jgi:hypothetical protein
MKRESSFRISNQNMKTRYHLSDTIKRYGIWIHWTLIWINHSIPIEIFTKSSNRIPTRKITCFCLFVKSISCRFLQFLKTFEFATQFNPGGFSSISRSSHLVSLWHFIVNRSNVNRDLIAFFIGAEKELMLKKRNEWTSRNTFIDSVFHWLFFGS